MGCTSGTSGDASREFCKAAQSNKPGAIDKVTRPACEGGTVAFRCGMNQCEQQSDAYRCACGPGVCAFDLTCPALKQCGWGQPLFNWRHVVEHGFDALHTDIAMHRGSVEP